MAPPVAAWAAERSAGTAMAAHALKLSARQLGEVPLPVDREAWAEGARLLRRVQRAAGLDDAQQLLVDAGRVLVEAHDLARPQRDAVMRWWVERAGWSTGYKR